MSQPYLGEIRMFGGNFAPRGWSFCDGSLQSIAQNSALFALLGTTYGGDGSTTFGLPDLRGRVPVHMGQGPGLSPRTIGESAGTETVALTTTQLPSHAHVPRGQSTIGTQASPAGAVWAVAGQLRYSAGAPNVTLDPGSGGASGGAQPHENMVPFLAVSFIIALEGVFPSRN
ncbi:MAG: tail fiber protein [Vicinamibacteria bacterium]